MLNRFTEHIESNFPFLKKGKLLIAISGGLDSVVLTHLCHQLKLNISLAHCNFNLRGTESDADEDFVLDLAKNLELEAFIQRFDTIKYANKHKLSIQMAARELRYNWFQDLAKQLDFDYIITAHHADDDLETFLINFIRGTGLNGLTGIPENKNKVVRPLLTFSRETIENYAKENNIHWQEDNSNTSRKYLRNKLRHDVVPILKEINPQLLDSLQVTLNNLRQSESLVRDALLQASKDVIITKDDNILLDVDKLKKLNNTQAYLYQFLNVYGFREWNDIYNLLEAQPGKYVASKSHRLIKDRTYLILTEISDNSDFKAIQIEKNINEIIFNSCKLTLQEVNNISTTHHSSIFVDKDLLKYPLTVRKWQKGDYFYPFGMTGKKKLSKYFKDEKWSLPEKEEALVLVSNDDKIIWIINSRMDNRFKLTNNTKTILKIQLTQ